MNMRNDSQHQIHTEKDKFLVPYLLTCKDIEFRGSYKDGNIVFFKFYPLSMVQEAIERFYNRTASPIQPKDLFDSVERFRAEIFRGRKE